MWRRVLVPDTIKLELLRVVILRAFGWSGGHLHEFVTSEGDRYGSFDPLDEMPGVVSGANVKLTTVLRTATLQYIYDFGDYWEHRIQVEKTHSPDSVLRFPLLLHSTSGACNA